jgi:hypothetical protein
VHIAASRPGLPSKWVARMGCPWRVLMRFAN